MGVQVAARPGHEDRVLAVMEAFERSSTWTPRDGNVRAGVETSAGELSLS